MSNKSIRFATICALAAAVISGTNNFLTKIAVTAVKEPILFTTLKNSLVAVLLVGLFLLFKKWPEIRSATKSQFIKLFAIGAIGGSLPFALFFTGLSKTSAINAALIHKTLFIWVLIFAIPILKERMNKLQWLGVGAVFAANLFVGGFTGFKYNSGELMILGATILWAIENIIAKKALRDLSAITVAAARMTLGSLLLLLFLILRNGAVILPALNPSQWGWTLLTSALLFGYVLGWYSALKYAPATYVATLLVPATLITNILSVIFVTHSFAAKEFVSAFLFVTGIYLIISLMRKTESGNPVNEIRPVAFKTLPAIPETGFMDGVLRCSRYAFGPNRLHYCGPDANQEIASYINEGVSDPGLAHLLKQFQTMYPYLQHIAEANSISNPFEERVVEAYWIGNDLLENIKTKKFYHHLVEGQQIKKKVGAKSFELIAEKLEQGAVPHHSFHVLDIWKRTGHLEREHTLESMDECRVSWGRVVKVDGPLIIVLTRPLRYIQGKLFLGEPAQKKLTRRLESTYDIEQINVGDLVSIHWSVPCEIITPRQAAMLEKYTLRHLELANQTI
jgi:drug/metabolite transporter (DMT)-like permease